MTAEVIYHQGLRTEAVHLRSGNTIRTDAPQDNQGKGEAFSPTDLLATALATCMLTVMGIFAEKKGWSIHGAKATVNKVMASHPRRVDRLSITITMPEGEFLPEARDQLEKIARNCPVAQSVHPDLQQDVTFAWPQASKL